jgi:hypothetical protein
MLHWYDPSVSHGGNEVLGQVDATTPQRSVLPLPVHRLGNCVAYNVAN